MPPVRATAVDPREHALRTLALFLTRHGPVGPAGVETTTPDSPFGGTAAHDERSLAPIADPLVRQPGGDEDELPLALSA